MQEFLVRKQTLRVVYVAYTKRLYMISLCLSVFFWLNNPPVGQGLLIQEVSRSHATTHHSR